MNNVVVISNVTLDGVMQAPGRPDEDTRGGFEHGRWAVMPKDDPDIGSAMGERLAESAGLLLGRRTYEDLLRYWNAQTYSPFMDSLNMARKYVASRKLREPLPWPNSALLDGDVTKAVAELKKGPGKDLQIMGSGVSRSGQLVTGDDAGVLRLPSIRACTRPTTVAPPVARRSALVRPPSMGKPARRRAALVSPRLVVCVLAFCASAPVGGALTR